MILASIMGFGHPSNDLLFARRHILKPHMEKSWCQQLYGLVYLCFYECCPLILQPPNLTQLPPGIAA
jgi:hypothetical protein